MQPTQSQIRNRNKKRAEEKKRQEEARRKEASRPRPGSYQERAGGQSKPPKKEDKPTPASRPTSRFAGARDANLARINSDPRFAAPQPAPRSPAGAAPIHVPPRAFGAARVASADTGSVYAPQVPQRPSTPGQAVQQQANPFQGVGDVRGQELPQTNIQQDAQPEVGTQEYGGQQLQGIDQNGVDMERRRAFLDADNSMAGMKAVKELLNRRKLSISVEN
jgi:hypothetical protein